MRKRNSLKRKQKRPKQKKQKRPKQKKQKQKLHGKGVWNDLGRFYKSAWDEFKKSRKRPY